MEKQMEHEMDTGIMDTGIIRGLGGIYMFNPLAQ